MGKPHDWDDNEKLAWSTWELPSELAGSADDILHNLKAIEEYVKREGCFVEHGLLDVLVHHSSDLRPKLRFAKPSTHSIADALVSSLQQRPAPTPEPEPFQGTAQEKLVGTGVDVTGEYLSVKDKAAFREKVDKDLQMVREEIRKAKANLEEMHAKTECESLVVAKAGQNDHGFNALLKQVFAKNSDGSINWVHTYKARLEYASEHQWRLEHGLPTSPNVPLR